jgi:ABC-type branched-subunit amino acid transport system ATPase component
MDHLLEVKDLSKSFGGCVPWTRLASPCPKAASLALIGPNGAGKTTALNCISAVYPIDSGDLLYDGKKVQHLKAHQLARAGLTRTFQNLQIFSGMTVLENVMVGMHVRPGREFISCMLRIGGAGKEDHEARDKAMEMLGFFDLDHLAQKRQASSPMATANGWSWPGHWSVIPGWCS